MFQEMNFVESPAETIIPPRTSPEYVDPKHLRLQEILVKEGNSPSLLRSGRSHRLLCVNILNI